MRAICPANLTLLDLIVLIILANSTSYEASHCAVFFNLLPFHPILVQIFSSAPFSQTPAVYVPPLMAETKFHTHTKSQEIFFIF
jgi:hypothetical protein